MSRQIGVDVGGTNTDAVRIENGRVAAAHKTPTTEDVLVGVRTALAAVAAPRVDAVMIGTTQFVNAVIERRELAHVGALRIGLPASRSLPPFCDWPEDLAARVRGAVHMVEGGVDYDGRPIMPLAERAIAEAARTMRAAGIGSVAVAAVFSPLDPSMEERAGEILRQEIPGVAVTLSHELGRIGLLERENVALLNAALIPLAARTVRALEQAVAAAGLEAPLFLTQNDGTVISARIAARFPVLSFASGPTNSMRGAAFLTGLRDALVVDVGGTTADFGALKAGFPRQANTVVQVGGVRTLFRMPDLLSIGLGGGSLVRRERDQVRVGPQSVGFRLTREALVFGGHTVTATDAAVRAGRVWFGDPVAVSALDPDLARAAMAEAARMIEEATDRMKGDATLLPLLAVGGGAFLVPDRLAGISEVLRPAHAAVANAVGAAIAQVSGEIDQVFHRLSRSEAIAEAERIARLRAVEAGADPGSLELVEIEDLPLAYMPGGSLRVRVRVVGTVARSAWERRASP